MAMEVVNQKRLIYKVVPPDIHHRSAMGDSLNNRAVTWFGDNQIGRDEEAVKGEWD